MAPPLFNHDPRFRAVSEVFHRQALVAKLAVETLIGTVLPRLARLRQRHLQALVRGPLQQPGRDELRAIVRTYRLDLLGRTLIRRLEA